MSGDQARVTALVAVPIGRAFELFTEDIDRWWRRGPRFRHLGELNGTLRLEGERGGRFYEFHDGPAGRVEFIIGTVLVWEPPTRLLLSWRNRNFAPGEVTEVEVLFRPSGADTEVVVTHRGWAALRPDHPARHGQTGPAFARATGLWWADLLGALRLFADPRG